MSLEDMNPKVDFYFAKAKNWQEEIKKLRTIILSCHLTEELKWGVPCYTLNKKNVVLIHVFKDYCAILFFKGALLADPAHVLIQQTENVQAARQMRFTNLKEITKTATLIKEYVFEAIEIENTGMKVLLKKSTDMKLVEEFQTQLDANPALKEAFQALTPGRQRAYNLYFSSAKQSKTRTDRVAKYIKQILKGKGLDD